jgi:hypothetical protein
MLKQIDCFLKIELITIFYKILVVVLDNKVMIKRITISPHTTVTVILNCNYFIFFRLDEK